MRDLPIDQQYNLCCQLEELFLNLQVCHTACTSAYPEKLNTIIGVLETLERRMEGVYSLERAKYHVALPYRSIQRRVTKNPDSSKRHS